MAKRVNAEQSPLEKLIYPIDWSEALLAGVTVSDVSITHTPPNGSAATFGKQVSSPITYIKSPSGLAAGKHTVSVVAITSNADLQPEVRLQIKVE